MTVNVRICRAQMTSSYTTLEGKRKKFPAVTQCSLPGGSLTGPGVPTLWVKTQLPFGQPVSS